MSRSLEIDNFLKYYGQLYHQNPNLEINRKTLYAGLASYGFNEMEFSNRDIADYFPKWVERFSSKQNLNVFYSDMQKGFLQFQNKNADFDYKCVKLYLSYPKEKLFDCANKIFDFIEHNDFATLSKISERIRSDSIVLRMSTVEDARKVMDFINSDPELVQNAKSTNPFLVRDGVVGIAYDDMMSFNSVLSDLMSKYFNQRRSQNSLDIVSIYDFRNYVTYQYSSIFRDANNLQNFSNSNISKEDIMRCGSMSSAILNYEQIYQTIIMSLDDKINSNDILASINNFKNRDKNNAMVDYYNSVLQSEKYHVKKGNIEIDADLAYSKNIVDNYILHAINKYGLDNVGTYLIDYMLGNKISITRDNNYRSLFAQYVSIEQLKTIVNGDINSYIKKVYNANVKQNQEVNNEKKESTNVYYAKNFLDGYIMLAASKYGAANVSRYLNSYIQNNPDAITREQGYRQIFSTYMTPNLVNAIAGHDIESYINNVINGYSNNNVVEDQRHI